MLLLIVILTLAYASIYYYYKQRFSYWQKRRIPHLEPSIPLGDLSAPWKGINHAVQFAQHYRTFRKRRQRDGGIFIFSTPIYMPVEADCIKDILIKDFHHFASRGMYYNERDEPILANLFFTEGLRWKNLRQKLTFAFTSGKMKMMFGTMLKCIHSLLGKVEQLVSNGEAINIKEISGNYSTDVIGSCAFGIECNSFESSETDFRKYGKMIFDENIFKSLKILLTFAFQDLAKKLGVTVLEKEADVFFTKMVTATYEYRKKNNIQRNDFMQLLIELSEKNPDQTTDALTMNEVIAQAFAFFIAGFDTSSTTLTFCLFELASDLDIQARLRNEIKDILEKYKEEICYEAIQDMKYMDQVINETLRKNPVVAMLNRICTETYENPSTGVVIEKGTPVIISCLGIHKDPEYYPDPEKFDPERFSDVNKAKIVPGTYLPFGDGPRICIGLRFGLMQVKVCLVSLLRQYEMTVNSRTKVPLEIDLGFVTTVKGGVWLNMNRIT